MAVVDKSMTFGEHLRQKREDLMSKDSRYSQENIAARLGRGFSQPTLSKIERGLKPVEEIHPRDLQRLLDEYGFGSLEIGDLAEKFGLALVSRQTHLATFQSDTQVPLQSVNVYPAGTGPAWDIDDILDVVGIPDSVYPGVQKIGLRAMSDSMTPYLPKGAVAVVALDDGLVKPGDFCGVWMNGDGVVVKRFVKEVGGELLLESLNPDPGEDRIFTAPLGSRIMGKVVKRVMDG
ncbi:MAG: helix-turn-helix domain-containing protein [Deinococcota bacterium]|jgi:SOS-response transcriptional repressor LexA|nr:helix-turn-helix domain-containing protein [Deinococcota bacterium]MDQ3457988.1 helix-turn-helix domain-containing protein [Deinococcota bacterium]